AVRSTANKPDARDRTGTNRGPRHRIDTEGSIAGARQFLDRADAGDACRRDHRVRRLVDIRLWIGSDDQVQADLISSTYIPARRYCFDLAATAFLFVSASVVAGRIWRFPFDDEIATLSKIEPEAAREFVTNFPTSDDIHPPFSVF